MTQGIPLGDPLARSELRPVLYGALGAIFHLEHLGPEDEEPLEHVSDRIWEWIGPELRVTSLSAAASFEPSRRSHLDYISTYAANLDARAADAPATQFEANNYTKFGRTDYEVTLNGAEDPAAASPYSVRFWSEIGAVSTSDLRLPSFAALHLTVPESWPIGDFYSRVCAIAAELRLRWGAAGLTYSDRIVRDPALPSETLYAHARRHPGYDSARYIRAMEPFYDRLRTVNWLTFIGPVFAKRLADMGRPLVGTPHVGLSAVGGSLLLQAGATPQRGDINRLQIPFEYREADALVRPLRTSDGKDLVFLGPWDRTTITAWLRRFELRVG